MSTSEEASFKETHGIEIQEYVKIRAQHPEINEDIVVPPSKDHDSDSDDDPPAHTFPKKSTLDKVHDRARRYLDSVYRQAKRRRTCAVCSCMCVLVGVVLVLVAVSWSTNREHPNQVIDVSFAPSTLQQRHPYLMGYLAARLGNAAQSSRIFIHFGSQRYKIVTKEFDVYVDSQKESLTVVPKWPNAFPSCYSQSFTADFPFHANMRASVSRPFKEHFLAEVEHSTIMIDPDTIFSPPQECANVTVLGRYNASTRVVASERLAKLIGTAERKPYSGGEWPVGFDFESNAIIQNTTQHFYHFSDERAFYLPHAFIQSWRSHAQEPADTLMQCIGPESLSALPPCRCYDDLWSQFEYVTLNQRAYYNIDYDLALALSLATKSTPIWSCVKNTTCGRDWAPIPTICLRSHCSETTYTGNCLLALAVCYVKPAFECTEVYPRYYDSLSFYFEAQ
jgi:hypothetical protein